MTSLDILIEHLEGALAAAHALKAEQKEAVIDDWIPATEAADRFEQSKELIQKWCQRDPSFGQKRDGSNRWYVSIAKMQAKLGIR
ncbi:hypothetical protein [Mesorhizobium sp. NZP2234]|uniref:hypothetical protein n=1 Tax=Mesorhizobium sp. NZP2234 TaxID=2483402 RepID=UPI0015549FEA|nr:hypothetical protein [Mesorhizobium sp. NZP2234]